MPEDNTLLTKALMRSLLDMSPHWRVSTLNFSEARKDLKLLHPFGHNSDYRPKEYRSIATEVLLRAHSRAVTEGDAIVLRLEPIPAGTLRNVKLKDYYESLTSP